eukprot:927563-Pelagomonas_calceolata.AAC.5
MAALGVPATASSRRGAGEGGEEEEENEEEGAQERGAGEGTAGAAVAVVVIGAAASAPPWMVALMEVAEFAAGVTDRVLGGGEGGRLVLMMQHCQGPSRAGTSSKMQSRAAASAAASACACMSVRACACLFLAYCQYDRIRIRDLKAGNCIKMGHFDLSRPLKGLNSGRYSYVTLPSFLKGPELGQKLALKHVSKTSQASWLQESDRPL